MIDYTAAGSAVGHEATTWRVEGGDGAWGVRPPCGVCGQPRIAHRSGQSFGSYSTGRSRRLLCYRVRGPPPRAFVGLIAGMATVAWVASYTPIAFLWHNVIGAVTVVVVGLAVSMVDPARRRSA